LRPQSVETRNKKQEEKRKLNRKNWKGNFLILEMGAWKMFPPPPPKKLSEIDVLLSQMQLMSKLFSIEFP